MIRNLSLYFFQLIIQLFVDVSYHNKKECTHFARISPTEQKVVIYVIGAQPPWFEGMMEQPPELVGAIVNVNVLMYIPENYLAHSGEESFRLLANGFLFFFKDFVVFIFKDPIQNQFRISTLWIDITYIQLYAPSILLL